MDGNHLVELLDKHFPSAFWEEYDYFFKYFNAMKKESETIKDVSAIGQKEPIPLEDIYVSLKVSEKREYEIPIKKEIDRKEWMIEKEKSKREKKFDADEAAKELDRLVIVGVPGSGKTTLLKHLALKFCKENLETQKRTTVPILIQLRQFSESNMDLRKYIDKVAEQYDFPKARDFIEKDLRKGKCELLLDGFDELATRERQREVTHQIEEFIREYPKNRFIVTSRVAGYHDELKGFQRLELMEFDNEQKKRFITNWFGRTNPKKARLMTKIMKENERIGAIARNPLMISMIAIIYEEDRELPQRRVELYQRCVEVLLSKWDVKRRIKNKYDAKAKEKLLRKLALETHISEKRTFTREEVLEKFSYYLPEFNIEKKKADDVLNEIVKRNGLLKEISIDEYDFLHLSFLEYLAGLELREKKDYETLLQHLYDPWWEEVILLFAGFDRDATELIVQIQKKEKTDERFKEDIFHSNLILMGKCIADSDYTDVGIRTQLVNDLWHLYRTAKYSSLKEKAIGVLSLIKSERIFNSLIEDLNNEDSHVRASAADALGRIGSERAVELLIETLNDDNGEVRWRAADALGEIGSEKAAKPLAEALNDDDDEVKWRAADALGRIGSEKAVKPLIKALNDNDDEVRKVAAFALGEIGSEKAVKPLTRTLNDEDKHVRWSAAFALGKLGSENAVELLARGLGNEDSDQKSILGVLAEVGSEKTVEQLIRALKDEDSYVRESAADALGKLESKRAVEQLIRTLEDENLDVRASAADALGRIGSEKAVEPLIKALKDEDSYVRERAAFALGMIESEVAVEPLIEALKDEGRWAGEKVKDAAFDSLEKISRKTKKKIALESIHI